MESKILEPLFDHTIVYFDWDDSLMPTNKLTDFIVFDQKEVIELCQPIADSIIDTFEEIKKYSSENNPIDIYIVTNADDQWVEYISKKYLPSVYEYLINNKINIISAKSLYEKTPHNLVKEFELHPQIMWKLLAFIYILVDKFGEETIKEKTFNLISIGDSFAEYHALLHLLKITKKSIGKFIRLKKNPEMEDIVAQLDKIIKHWPIIHNNKQTLCISMEK